MERRKFLKFLGLAPAAIAVAKFLPKHDPMQDNIAFESNAGKITPEVLADGYAAAWQPNTAYAVGDRISFEGKIRTIKVAGTSGSPSWPRGTTEMELS